VLDARDGLLAEDLEVVKRTLLDPVSSADVLMLAEYTLGRWPD